MNKITFSIFCVIILATTTLWAEHSENHTGKGHYYVIPKVLEIEGDSKIHEGTEIKGQSGSGYALDIGYSFAEHFAVEFATSYSTDEVVANNTEYDAKYITYGIDLAYTHHFTKHLGMLLKTGYGFEDEEITGLNINELEHGLTYALGLEYGMSSRTEFILEYEHALIESTRGASLFVGVKFKF